MQGGQDGNSERTHKARHRWPCITKPSAPSSSHHIYAACIGNQITASTKLQISDPPQKKNTPEIMLFGVPLSQQGAALLTRAPGKGCQNPSAAHQHFPMARSHQTLPAPSGGWLLTEQHIAHPNPEVINKGILMLPASDEAVGFIPLHIKGCQRSTPCSSQVILREVSTTPSPH